MRSLILLALCLPAWAQYKMDAAGSAAPNSALQSPGIKIVSGNGQLFCEIWLAKNAPQGGTTGEASITLPTVPVGALLGAIRFPARAADRRGQAVPAGTYLLRYAPMPVDAAHLGVAPQRDFAALVPATDSGEKMSLDDVTAASAKVSGTKHPAVLSIAPGSGKTGLTEENGHDWTLNTKMGDLPIAIIVAGKA